jgi:hypothetical protein
VISLVSQLQQLQSLSEEICIVYTVYILAVAMSPAYYILGFV